MSDLHQILFLGPPASGKGTQARRLSEHLSVPYCSTGELLREEQERGTALGLEIGQYLLQGLFVPDHFFEGAIEERLLQGNGGFVLDGYPRTLAQGRSFDERLRSQNRTMAIAILLEVPFEMLLQRVQSRVNCGSCGRIWSMSLIEGDQCPVCDAPLEQRQDDSTELFRSRYAEYANKTLPLVPFYEDQNRLLRIDGEGSIDEVFGRILKKVRP